jgi:hypothetical protein
LQVLEAGLGPPRVQVRLRVRMKLAELAQKRWANQQILSLRFAALPGARTQQPDLALD